MNKREEWRGIAGYPRYEASSLGRIRSWAVKGEREKTARKPHMLRTTRHMRQSPYWTVALYGSEGRRTHMVHVLVLEAFKGSRPKGKYACHLNGDSLDNRIENLAWGTKKASVADTHRRGRGNDFGHGMLPPALTEAEVIDVYRRGTRGEKVSSIAADYPHVSEQTVRIIVKGKQRKGVIEAYLSGATS